MNFSFQSVLLSTLLSLGQINAALSQDKPAQTNASTDKDRRLTKEELDTLYEIANLTIKYNSMKLPPMATKLSSRQEIENYILHHHKEHAADPVQYLPIVFNPSNPAAGKYHDINLQDMIDQAKKNKKNHLFLTEKGHEDKGIMLSIQKAEKLQQMNVTAHQELGLSNTNPIMMRYHDTPYIEVIHDAKGKKPVPGKTILHTATVTKPEALIDWLLKHERHHDHNRIKKPRLYHDLFIKGKENSDEISRHLKSKPDGKITPSIAVRRQEEVEADSSATVNSHEGGAFLLMGEDKYKAAIQTKDPVASLMKLNVIELLNETTDPDYLQDDHPTNFRRLVEVHKQHKNNPNPKVTPFDK